MSMRYIRDTYQVPAKRGARIKFTGNPHRCPCFGTITGSQGAYIRVRMDGDTESYPYHPAWAMEYVPANTALTGRARDKDSAWTKHLRAPVERIVSLLPCPFCGSDRIALCARRASRTRSGYSCECRDCGVRQVGRLYGSRASSAEAWNKRANTAVSHVADSGSDKNEGADSATLG